MREEMVDQIFSVYQPSDSWQPRHDDQTTSKG